jgi:hypothetical protein
MKRYEALPERHMVHVCQRKGCPYYGTAGRAICSDTGHQAAVPFVPEQRLEGAVEALHWAMDHVSPPEPGDPSPSAASFAAAYAKAVSTLNAARGR